LQTRENKVHTDHGIKSIFYAILVCGVTFFFSFLDYKDFEKYSKKINYLQELEYSHKFFEKYNLFNCLIIQDDFTGVKNAELVNFRAILNHFLRHNNVSLFLTSHNFQKINFYSELHLAQCYFITKSEVSKKFCNLYKNRGLFIQNGFDQLKTYEILFLNFQANYSLIISIEKDNLIFKKMFFEDKTYVIHDENIFCSSETDIKNTEIDYSLSETELLTMYSKNSRKFKIIYSCLKRNNLLKNDFIVLNKDIRMHLCDFLNLLLHNNLSKHKFSKNEITFLKNLIPMSTYDYPRSIFPNSVKKYLKFI